MQFQDRWFRLAMEAQIAAFAYYIDSQPRRTLPDIAYQKAVDVVRIVRRLPEAA